MVYSVSVLKKSDFLKKAQARLQSLVERSGILVFASHSNEFLARLCKTAMWVDHGTIKMTGGIEDVVRAYEGEDAARHVREVLEEHRGDWSPTEGSSCDWSPTDNVAR